ncbi:histidine triad nucleotide-binding protein [Ruminococcaceae bacterium OttesenSCG-928-I18]|nr:histidine triad nucleotide-binding protein [Ruminococcaceae bacterium OttesenSCG-928-I18]
MADCLFCKIANHEIDSLVLYEDDEVLAFRDIDPKAPTHILVIPKKHVDSAALLSEADGPLLGRIFSVIAKLAEDEKLEKGWRVVANVGEEGGQTVGHLHFHLLGGRQMYWPPG